MKKRGAKEGDLVALLAATGAQTETIPPSIVLITIGKNAIDITTRIFEPMPAPTQTRISGAIAIFGTLCRPTKIGMISFSKSGKRIISADTSSANTTAVT